MNASMGNAPELIIAIFALQQGLYDVILVSLIGSMLSNLLLVLGTSLFVGSICNPPFQRFKAETSGMTASMLLLSVTTIAAPTLIVATSSEDWPDAALLVSRICALFLLFLYILFLIFQMKTHSHLFEDGGVVGEEELAQNDDAIASQLLAASKLGAEGTRSSGSSGLEEKEKESMDSIKGDGEEGEVKLSMWGSILWLVVIAAVVALVSENLVRSIDGAAQSWGLGQAFISCIMLPIAGNAAEHFSAVLFAKRNRLDLSLGIAIGSTLQIALFVLPLLVVLGWVINKPVTLDSKPFQAGSLVMAVLMTVFLLLNGKSYWMSGVVLVLAYAVVATGFGMYSFQAEGNNSFPTNSTHAR
jgi:Ca2+:H+ antiporter